VSSAHRLIYEENYAVSSAPVEQLLKPQSWVPTSNAFSECLGCLGFNIFCALVIDLLHEFEIGIHLLCIICAQDKGLIHELDRRYDVSSHTHWSQLIFTTRFRQTPTFGQATIHKFSTDSSEMKRMAARNFEGRI
ncbi:hypothetical protein P692DRAFT_20754046, partial [Suillus brevipes Sb2]